MHTKPDKKLISDSSTFSDPFCHELFSEITKRPQATDWGLQGAARNCDLTGQPEAGMILEGKTNKNVVFLRLTCQVSLQ